MGRILFNYLAEKYPTKYQVFGIDQHLNISTRYQSINIDNIKIKSISSISTDKFFQCDVTDRTKLHQIIQEQKIEIIIHLAALLANYADIDKISHVNIDEPKNIFEARTMLVNTLFFLN
ncbi:unnamed protein product [Rotaria magnacalcarata]|uniref:NAD(P)-binding domain-containing protein n=1 Tax=Rotaria magnacalcarata TaxID=392030 RepID=A0A816YZG6_9BILA|nr:unnamed protein product [Rotaria magnacalcarata]CAF2181205.1 unnamed protein product [Rotaria magnacalcarata]